ncbi:nucleoside 2-deoxyribosyltransferase [Flavobacterium sp. D11R37]|uniref:nucleoside 2-deoxyribosyltransferase n=1 Tax=Flavobacterium coralii TaxID=2838017 RepID=UPI001CA6BC6F|nr:nucleoside 2-deoxyribosyltransferase [Flavobacterium coralii]MBY8963021.1 nucleoside 2-deoxyribosyltransferase [Flavobacterium coralii]
MQTTTPKTFCFVLMPFDNRFDDIYTLGIKQSCIDSNAYCERVDEQIFHESILERIYNQIAKADLIIADLTDKNPNVFYEVGYAHALGKKTILLTQNSDDIPFDLKHYPHIIYNNKITQLKDELTKKVKWFIENSSSNKFDYKIGINLYLESESLDNHNNIYIAKGYYSVSPTFTIHNNGTTTYYPEDYSIGIITDINYTSLRIPSNSKTIKLPDGKLLHMVPKIDEILYPNSYTELSIQLLPKGYKVNGYGDMEEYYKESQEIIIRVFTSNHYRDFYLTIKFTVK